MNTETNHAGIGIANSESPVGTVMTALMEGHIDNAVSQFSEQFAFNDYGIGLEFRDKARLTEFFQKTRELYPDSLLLADTFFECGDRVISEWTLRGLRRQVGPNRAIYVFHIDQPSNDFNSLFSVLDADPERCNGFKF